MTGQMKTIPGYALLATGMFFLGSVQILLLGIIGEYIGRLYQEAAGRARSTSSGSGSEDAGKCVKIEIWSIGCWVFAIPRDAPIPNFNPNRLTPRPGSRLHAPVVGQRADHLLGPAWRIDREQQHRLAAGIDCLVVDRSRDVDQRMGAYREGLRYAAAFLEVGLHHLLPFTGQNEEDLLGTRVVVAKMPWPASRRTGP